MSTFLLKAHPSRGREHIFKIESYRDKVPLILFEDNHRLPPAHPKHLHLPNIYQTEHLIPNKQSLPSTHNKENDSVPKLFKRHFKQDRKQVSFKRILTDEKDKEEPTHLYHNFVTKKKNNKKVHMSKIIEKVISEDIEPWEHSKLHPSKKSG